MHPQARERITRLVLCHIVHLQEEEEQLIRLQVEAEERVKRQAWKDTFESLDQEKVEKRRREEDLMKQLANVKDPARVKEIVEAYRKRQQRRSITVDGSRSMYCTATAHSYRPANQTRVARLVGPPSFSLSLSSPLTASCAQQP